jgi:hypothetical protein
MRGLKRATLGAVATAAAAMVGAGLVAGPALASGHNSFIGRFPTNSQGPSTVPANGDVNPYGVALVKQSAGMLQSGNVLVSNFNNAGNFQGTGTTIVQVSPGGTVSQFARITPKSLPEPCPGGVGLTTALEILRGGWVVVGSLPTAHKGSVFTGAGCLIVLNNEGTVVETLSGHGINGPWDMGMLQHGPFSELFVTNVLNGTAAAAGQVVHRGTVVRLTLGTFGGRRPELLGSSTVGSGFAERTDPAALVLGPTGLAVAGNGTVYVADTLANRIAAIPDAVSRTTSAGRGLNVTTGGALNAPLGLIIAPDGHILTVNGGDGNIVETTPSGVQVAVRQLDSSGSPPGAGALFGLAVAPHASGVYYVDDATNNLNLLH